MRVTHVAGAGRLTDHLVQQVRHPREVRRVFRHATARRQRVVLDRAERLGDLVGERGRHLPGRVHPYEVRQALPPLRRLDLRGLLPALGRLARVQAREHLGQQTHPGGEALGPHAVFVCAREKKRPGDRAGDQERHGQHRAHPELAQLRQVGGRLRRQFDAPREADNRAVDQPGADPPQVGCDGRRGQSRGLPMMRSAELVATGNPLPQAHPLQPEEEADVLEPLLDRATLLARPGKEQRREDAGCQAFEAGRLLQLFLRALAGEGAAEDLRQEPHPLEQLLRPGPLPPDAPEAEASVQLPVHDHRHRHVGFQPDALIVHPVDARLRRQVVQTREHDGPVCGHERPCPGPEFRPRPERDGALHPGDGIGVRDLDPSGSRRPRVQGAPIDTKGFDDAMQPVVDGFVDARRRKVDEAGG